MSALRDQKTLEGDGWYLTSLLLRRKEAIESRPPEWVRKFHYLITAPDQERAYQRSLRLGTKIAAAPPIGGEGAPEEEWTFVGLWDLLMVYDPPRDGSELAWYEEEIPSGRVEEHVQEKLSLRAFAQGALPAGWYVASLVLEEIHDDGSHGDNSLVWINSYLIRADSAELAYQKALRLGNEQQTERGSHSCDGDKAHWEFIGIRDLIPLHSPPSDGSLLWFDDFHVNSTELEGLVSAKRDLSVFQSEAERRKRTGA